MFCFSSYHHSPSSVWCWSGDFFVRQWFDVDHGEWGERESESNRDQEREKIVKILNAHATITVHICMVTVAIVHLCTTLHPLIWVYICSKCVKLVTFSILHILIRMLLHAYEKTIEIMCWEISVVFCACVWTCVRNRL